ncbi:hypothetical protein [Solilutibacter tolerans]|uniref:Uncharacterized protein n=1 Tax=Solilutibacter tolerans TaxID=1604334 RepID=A0A1N6N3Q1_9GAMM|nr:hypothetical protein [Lysobacter tolerans]SIP86682.1 hypothetical protein SAMN05421546_0066 [Lysobacter tolerans]
MSFMTISAHGLLQDPDSVRIERVLQARVDRLLAALERVMPEGIRFSDWARFEDNAIHIDLQVDGPVNQHPLVLAESLATGAHRVHDRYFAAFRREQALEPLEGDSNWLAVNAAVHAIEAIGGEVRIHAGKPHERRLAAIDPDFLRLADTWNEGIHVDNALLVGLTVLPSPTKDGLHSIIILVANCTDAFVAVVSDQLLADLQPGRTRVCFQYLQAPDGSREVVPQTLMMRPAINEAILAVCGDSA